MKVNRSENEVKYLKKAVVIQKMYREDGLTEKM
jgi:hypothetical protein